jgi:uncharacterized protein
MLHPRLLGPTLLVSLLGLLSTAHADRSNSDFSKPALVSTTGGKTWSNLQELQKAADSGDPAAQEAYGEMLQTGDEGVPKNVLRALELFEKAAKAGNAAASFRLGKTYEDGQDVPRDAAKAMEYYKIAAAHGVAAAQYNLGAMYVSARDGIKRDYREGLAWLIVGTKHGAEGDGEKRVRDRLAATKRADLIPAAEKRAAEIEEELAAQRKRTESGQKNVSAHQP